MPNAYLEDCHRRLSAALEEAAAERTQALARGDRGRAARAEGRLLELTELRRFLSDRFDLTTQRYY